MSVRIASVTAAFKAAGDLSTNQYYVVKQASGDNEVELAGAADDAVGFLGSCPAAAGETAEVVVSGGSYALAGAAIAKDVKVTANASGKIVAAAATEFYIGRTLAAAAADGDVVEIVIEKGFVPA